MPIFNIINILIVIIIIDIYNYYDVIKGHMVAINSNFSNYNNVVSFMNIFNGFDNDFKITSDGVLLRNNNFSNQAISDIMKLIFPQSKGTVFRGFIESMEEVEIPENGKAYIVHYDEQVKFGVF